MNNMRIVIAGAGSIGFFVGGLLTLGGKRVTFLGRPRLNDEIARNGLRLTDYSGLDETLAPRNLALSTSPEALMAADLILVCVKSGATSEMAAEIATHAAPGTPIVSLQNGIAAVRDLRVQLPDRDVRAGMVVFNVVPKSPGQFHRATSGDILIASGPGAIARELSVPGLSPREHDDMDAVQWGKLVLNLTNALNALSGLPLREFLPNSAWRRLMADQLTEALAVLRAAGQPIVPATPIPTAFFPWVLRLPTPLFQRVASKMLTVDPSARTSMSYDLDSGRPTEIGAFQGEIIALGKAHGVATPLNSAVAQLVRASEGQNSHQTGTRPDAEAIRKLAAGSF